MGRFDHDRSFWRFNYYFKRRAVYQAKANCIIFCFSSNPFIPQFFKKYLIKSLLEKQISLPEEVWKKLNFSWILFFVFLGCLNFYVASNFSTDFWVEFKLFGMLAITLVFTIIQAIWLARFKNEQ